MSQEEIQALMERLITLLTEYGISVLGALVILILGVWISGVVSRSVRQLMNKSQRIDPTIIGFTASLVRYALIAFTLVAVLERFGVETTSFIAVLGALGLAVGLALQGTLANFAAGVMLLIFRPFKVGQSVDIGGIAGTVRVIDLFSTELDTPDNVHIIVPNGQIWGASIRNFSYNDTRRIDIACGISYSDDVDKALAILDRIAANEERILKDPAPISFVDALADNSVNLVLRIWCRADVYWQLKWDVTKTIKAAFDEAGIEIPFPQRAVHIVGGLPGLSKT